MLATKAADINCLRRIQDPDDDLALAVLSNGCVRVISSTFSVKLVVGFMLIT